MAVVSRIPLPPAFVFGGTGAGEILLVFAVVLLLFGPRRLPEIARMLGRILTRLRRASEEFREQVMHMDSDGAEGPASLPPDAGDPEGNDREGPGET